MQMEERCRITHVNNPVHLVASHCKPWRDSNNQERLNGDNGLLLTPSIDHLFDGDSSDSRMTADSLSRPSHTGLLWIAWASTQKQR